GRTCGRCWQLLPEQFQAELDLARRGGGAGDDAGCGAYAGWREGYAVGRIEVGAIEKIEDFGAELQREAFSNTGVFERGEGPGAEAGADERIATKVAVEAGVGGGVGGRKERIGIEPLAGLAKHNWSAEIWIDEWANRIAGIAIAGRVVAKLRR